MKIDWEKPLEFTSGCAWHEVKITRTPVNDMFAIDTGWHEHIFDLQGNHIVEFGDSCVLGQNKNYKIRNKESYDIKVKVEMEGYQNALSKTTSELEKQKKLMENIKELQEQINELKEKESYVPYYPYYPQWNPPYTPTVFTTYSTTSDRK